MGYYSSMIVLIPAMIFTMICQSRISRAYNTFSQVANSRGITGAQAAKMVLNANGMSDVPINILNGDPMTNYFDPRNFTVNLSSAVYNSTSIASMCIACHEVGHAMQHHEGYAPIKLRNSIVPVVNFTSKMAWPLVFIGLFMSSASAYGNLLFNIGAICFTCVVIFHLITLPVEFNASNRALQQMQALGIVNDQDLYGSRKVLRAAGMTYVAALATAVATLLRILVMRGRND